MTTERTEDYLEVIYTIVESKGYARVKDVSRILGVGFSSVTEMFQKLSEGGFINYEKYGGVTLTQKGRKVAKKTKERHDTLTKFLLILGIDDKIADEDACKIEHIVNPETMERLRKFIEFVNRAEGGPRWLDHFKHYYATGEYIECSPTTVKDCPVHGMGSSKQ